MIAEGSEPRKGFLQRFQNVGLVEAVPAAAVLVQQVVVAAPGVLADAPAAARHLEALDLQGLHIQTPPTRGH
jgi:hypothetical protein